MRLKNSPTTDAHCASSSEEYDKLSISPHLTSNCDGPNIGPDDPTQANHARQYQLLLTPRIRHEPQHRTLSCACMSIFCSGSLPLQVHYSPSTDVNGCFVTERSENNCDVLPLLVVHFCHGIDP